MKFLYKLLIALWVCFSVISIKAFGIMLLLEFKIPMEDYRYWWVILTSATMFILAYYSLEDFFKNKKK